MINKNRFLKLCEKQGDSTLEECRKGCIYKAQEELGIQPKDKQLEAVYHFCCGNDVFVSLPTGYGKSVVYAILPSAFDKLTGKLLILISTCCLRINSFVGKPGSIVPCISPLTAIMIGPKAEIYSVGHQD